MEGVGAPPALFGEKILMFSYNKSLICGIDLGSSRIKAAAGFLDKKGSFLSLEYAQAKIRGMEDGLVTDISVMSRLLKETVASLEGKIKQKIKRAVININNPGLILKYVNAVIPLCERGNKIVTSSDVNSVNSQACSLNLKLDEEVLHKFVHHYILDDSQILKIPNGLYGHKLAVNLFLIAAKINSIENIVRLANQSGLEVEDLVFSGVAESLAVFDNNSKERGCVLIDIGADLTQVLIFKEGVLRFAEVINYGGNDVTACISELLKLPFELSEEIKEINGSAILKDIDEDEEVMVKKDDGYKPVKRSALCSVIEPEITQLFTRLKEKIERLPYLKGVDYSITISGASALLDGLIELAEPIFGVRVKLGIPRAQVNSMQDNFSYGKDLLSLSSRSVIYSTAIGLILYGYYLRRDNRLILFQSREKNVFTYLGSRLKDIYSEYF